MELRRAFRAAGARRSRALLAAAVGIAGALIAAQPLTGRPVSDVGAVHAQGRMDVGILTPSFSALPLSVRPGDQFDIGVNTAPGAACSGEIAFRDQPTIALERQPAREAVCTWTVAVPTTARPGTATILVDVERSGQLWRLFGVTYVSPVGESR